MPLPRKPTESEQKAAASAEELRVAQEEVVNLLKANKFLLRLLTGVVVVCLAVISVAGIIGARTGTQAREIGEQNNRFLDNFSNYMNCLIVNEDEVVIAVGEEAYVEICKQLLYRGIDEIPPTIKAEVPKDFPTTTTTSG
jgi:hypothetical protein